MVPGMAVVKLQHQSHILSGSIRGMSSNLSEEDALNYGGGGSGEVRTKESGSIWDEEW